MKRLKHLHPVKRWNKSDPVRKLFVVLVALLIVVGGLIAWAQYQDAQNEDLLRNISADFAQLEQDLESELGVDVENKSGCFTTQEKFSDGKTGCFMRISYIGIKNIKSEARDTVSTGSYFSNYEDIDDRYSEFTYEENLCYLALNKDSGFTGFALECPVPVRAGNSSLVAELF